MRINSRSVDVSRALERARASNRVWKDGQGTERVLGFPTSLHAWDIKHFSDEFICGAMNFEAPYPFDEYWATGETPLPDVKLMDWIATNEKIAALAKVRHITVYPFVNGNPYTDIMMGCSVQPSIDSIEVFVCPPLKDKILEIVESEGYEKYALDKGETRKRVLEQMKLEIKNEIPSSS